MRTPISMTEELFHIAKELAADPLHARRAKRFSLDYLAMLGYTE